MFNSLRQFHQKQAQTLQTLINQTQAKHGVQQGHNPQMNPYQNQQFQQNRQQVGYQNNQQTPNNPNGNYFNQNNQSNYNKSQHLINYLVRVKSLIAADLGSAQINFVDMTNLNNTSNPSVQMEIKLRINDKPVGLVIKVGPQHPRVIPELRFSQTLIHEDIDRTNNQVKLDNITNWQPNKKVSSLIKEVEEFFRVSPPEHSPELEKLFSEVVLINKALLRLKNLNFKSFMYHLNPDQQRALQNGDYLCLKESEEYKAVQTLMLKMANTLNNVKTDIKDIESKYQNTVSENQHVIIEYKEKLAELEGLKSRIQNLHSRFDAENIRKFLQNESNMHKEKCEEIREKMLTCDDDDLPTLQEEFTQNSRSCLEYLGLMEKGFGY